MITHVLAPAEIEALREVLSCMDDDGQIDILCNMALECYRAKVASLVADTLANDLAKT